MKNTAGSRLCFFMPTELKGRTEKEGKPQQACNYVIFIWSDIINDHKNANNQVETGR
jgi:hypothetical protein